MSEGAVRVICTPGSLDRKVGLGAQAHERRLREAAEEAGRTRYRRATETLANPVLQARR